jgi:ABC-2 type transport system ATP-binding protein
MRQRATLARTLLNDPQLLLLDEPADGLDPRARIELRELLQALAEQGKAILISSHILTELSEMCDACAIIEQGRLLATGDVGQILTQSGRSTTQLDVRIQLIKSGDVEARSAQCERLLLEQPGVKEVHASGATLKLKLEGDEVRANALLKALIAADVPVCAFQLHEANLEDAFMSVTRGRVQ